jgi:hypothetical protein
MRDVVPHETVPMQVWADIDVGVADMVRDLNQLPGVRTHASCQGTIGEGGAEPYPAYVEVSWDDHFALRLILQVFDLKIKGENWGHAHRKEGKS